LGILLLFLLSWTGQADARATAEFSNLVKTVVTEQEAAIGNQWRAIESTINQALPVGPAPTSEDPALKSALRAMHRFYERVTARSLPRISIEVERAFAEDFFAGFFAEGDNEPQLLATTQTIAQRLGRAATRSGFAAKVGILHDGGIMAFAKGGHWIILSDEIAAWPTDQTAAVVAHELAHLVQRDYVALMIARQANALVLQSIDAERQPALKRFLELALLRLHRFQEFRADVSAVRLMQRAGYDPRGLEAVLERLADLGAGSKNTLLTDHPPASQRLASLRRIPKNSPARANR
jgi:predicted Zn-dependent protease